MTDQQREKIIKLRRLNYGYKTIANKLGIPVDTVKSYCKRHNIIKGFPQSDSYAAEHFCMQCGNSIIQDPKRKEKKFCSDACRIKWWNSHSDLIKTKTGHSVICAYCRKEFYVNKQSNRKYCSHSCYIEDRFHGTSIMKEKKPEGKRNSLTEPHMQIKPVHKTAKMKTQEVIPETISIKDDSLSVGEENNKLPFLTEEEKLDLLNRIKSIKCICRNCNTEYEFYSGFGMRYCCSQCFVDDHPGAYFDDMNNVKYDKQRLSLEEFQDVFTYSITKNFAQKMVRQSIITLKEYFEFMILMLKKYCPIDAPLFLEVEIGESSKAKTIDEVFNKLEAAPKRKKQPHGE